MDLALRFGDIGNHERAGETYMYALKLLYDIGLMDSPESGMLMLNISWAMKGLGKNNKALQMCKEARNRFPIGSEKWIHTLHTESIIQYLMGNITIADSLCNSDIMLTFETSHKMLGYMSEQEKLDHTMSINKKLNVWLYLKYQNKEERSTAASSYDLELEMKNLVLRSNMDMRQKHQE